MYVIQTSDGQLSRFFKDITEVQQHLAKIAPSVVKAVVPQADGSELLLPVATIHPQVIPLEGRGAPQYTPMAQPQAVPASSPAPAPTAPPSSLPQAPQEQAPDLPPESPSLPQEPLVDENDEPIAPSDKRRVDAKYAAYSTVTLEELGETPLHEVAGVASAPVGGVNGGWVVDTDD